MHRVLGIAGLLALSGSLQGQRLLVTATDTGIVAAYDKSKMMQPVLTFRPYRAGGGVFVAAGDLDGDGTDEMVIGPGAGVDGAVQVFNQSGLVLRSIVPYGAAFIGGVRVAVGDVTGDGVADIITGAGPGGTSGHVKVFDGRTGFESGIYAYPGFAGGVYVAAGDVNGDGVAEIITGGGPGVAGGHVKVFDAAGVEHASFHAYEMSFTGGVRVAVGDLTGDGVGEIIAGAGAGGGPHVKVFSGRDGSPLASFFAFDSGFTGGVHVAGAPVIVTPGAPSGGIATIRIFRMDGQVQWLMPFPGYTGGLTIGTSDTAMGKAPARPKLPGLK